MVLLIGAAIFDQTTFVILGIYLVASAVTVVAYTFDKLAAMEGRWRIQESTLHFLALIGGWPGALAAQRLLRHKTKKRSFQFIFWITVVLNCTALGILFSPLGAAVLHAILGPSQGLSD